MRWKKESVSLTKVIQKPFETKLLSTRHREREREGEREREREKSQQAFLFELLKKWLQI